MNKNSKLPLIGLLQALGVFSYCGLIGIFFISMEKFGSKQPDFLMIAFMLFLFVISAAVTGSLVFGYPVYLLINKKIKEALQVLVYTLLSAIIIFLAILIFII